MAFGKHQKHVKEKRTQQELCICNVKMANEAQFRHKTMIANAVGTFPELFRLQSNTALEVDNRIMQIIKLTD